MGKGLTKTTDRILRLAAALALTVGLCPWTGVALAAEDPSGGTPATPEVVADGATGVTDGGTAPVADPTTGDAGISGGTAGETAGVTDGETVPAASDDATDGLTNPDPALVTQGDGETASYNVYVGGVEVTDANRDDVLAGTPDAGKVKYIPKTSTESAQLILGDDSGTPLTISGVPDLRRGAAIYNQWDALTIIVKDPTTLSGASCTKTSSAGLFVVGDLHLEGDADLTVTGGDSTIGTPVNSNFSAGIYSAMSMSVSGIPSLTATGGDGNFASMGIYNLGVPSIPGSLTVSGSTQVTATGHEGTDWSVGVFSCGNVTLNDTARLVAKGARRDGGRSYGIRGGALILNGQASAEAYGDVAGDSIGVNTFQTMEGQTTGVKLADGTSLTAQGADAAKTSYGIYETTKDGTVGTVDVAGGATLGVAAGTASGTDGTSVGISGQLVYAGGTGTEGGVTVSCSTAATAKALDTAPGLTGTEYRWMTDAQTSWRYGATDAFVYSGTAGSAPELTVRFAQTSFPLWVGGTQVTMANRDNVLAGTANDGKVDFTPGVGDSELGVLGLDGANISGVADTRTGAGIYATEGLQIVASEDNTVTGATMTEGGNTGIHASALIIGGYGSLDITAAPAAAGGHATALDVEGVEDAMHSTAGSLTIQNAVAVTATAQAGTGSGVLCGDLTLADTFRASSLTAAGGHSAEGNAALSSVGVSCYGTITQAGHNTLTGIGGTAVDTSMGIFCASATLGGSDDASIVGTGGAVTSATDGHSYGMECFDGSLVMTGGRALLRSDSTVGTRAATNVAPSADGYAAYRWRMASTDEWTYSARTPFAFDPSASFLQITPPMGDLWVGGVKVTTENMDDILGDGTATFTPYGPQTTASSALSTESVPGTLTPQKVEVAAGVLTLRNANTSGVEDTHDGAAVYSDEPLRVLLQGDSTLVGADSASGDACGIHIAGAAIFGGSGTLSVGAGVAGDGNAVGILCDRYSDELMGMLVVLESATVDSQGGTVAKAGTEDPHGSLGVMGRQRVLVQDEATLRATGSAGAGIAGGVMPSSCVGVFTDDLQVHGDATVDARGSHGQMSAGVVIARNLVLDGSALLYAAGSGGTVESYGIYTVVDTGVNLDGGQLTARASGADGANEKAISAAPEVDMSLYHWRTGENDAFTLSSQSAYAYDGSQTYVQIGSAYDLTVGGVRVTEANRDNVLAGTANDGKVSFTLDGDTGSQGTRGTLHLDGATLAGVSGKDYGAGICSGLSGLTLDLTGENTVTGATGSIPYKLTCGIEAIGLTLRGSGSLDVKAADMSQSGGNRSYGVHGFVTMTGDAVATFAGGAADESAGLNGSLSMSSLSRLTCIGGTGARASYGAKLVGLRMDTQSQLTATGGSAATSAGVSNAGLKADVSGDASLTATGGTSTTASYGYRGGDSSTLAVGGSARITLSGGHSTGTSQASSSAVDLSGHDPYRWISDSVRQWTDSSATPYAYSADDRSLSVMRADFYPVWVEGVQVCDANRDNVLEGTVNDGKVRFVPAHDGQTAVLYLDGADITATSGENNGAGICSELPMTIQLSGSNSVTGAAADGSLTTLATDPLVPQSGPMNPAIGIEVLPDLVIAGDGDLDVTATDGKNSFGIATQGGLSIGESAFVTSRSGTASDMSAGVFATTSLDVHGDGYLAASAGTGGDSVGIITGAVHVSDQAIVLGNGARATDPDGLSDGVHTGTVYVEGGSLSGISDQGVTSYGIATGQTDGSFVITGGTVIGITQGTPGATVGAFSQAADVSGYDGYRWRDSSTGSYTYGGYTFSAADTYEEITPGIAPAPAPTPTPATGDGTWMVFGALTVASAAAAGLLLAARRRLGVRRENR